MLKRLTLYHIAIVESLAVDFEPGLTVITGETGSGKSILLDGIGLAFGAKANAKDLLQSGHERGSVELLFDLDSLDKPTQKTIKDSLTEIGVFLETDESELLLSRELTLKGTRARINGVPVSREILEILRHQLIDLHGQHDLTSLFEASAQRNYLDSMGDTVFKKLKRSVSETYQQWHTVHQQLSKILANQQAMERERDFLSFQLEELNNANLDDPEEDKHLKQQTEVLRNADQLKRLTAEAAYGLTDDRGVLDQLAAVEKKLSNAAQMDAQLSPQQELLTEALENLKQLGRSLDQYADSVVGDPEALQESLDRLDQLEKLKKKYGPSLPEVIETHTRIALELSALNHNVDNLDQLQASEDHLRTQLQTLSAQFSEQRQKLAKKLEANLKVILKELALPGIQFEIAFSPIEPTVEGSDVITFLFSANPGESVKPLAKVASGGELSRVLFALKVLSVDAGGINTLVFDEIDTGIGGSTARTLAEKLLALSRQKQVLMITHQPLIAAVGDQHYQVVKTFARDGVTVSVQQLENEDDRLRSLSQMLSGSETLADSQAMRDWMTALKRQPA